MTATQSATWPVEEKPLQSARPEALWSGRGGASPATGDQNRGPWPSPASLPPASGSADGQPDLATSPLLLFLRFLQVIVRLVVKVVRRSPGR